MKTNEQEKVIEELLGVINNHQIKNENLASILIGFLFSVGASLAGVTNPTAEEVLKAYGAKPTLGNALMAQALYMKETWKVEEGDIE
jgi:hypothetical protein